MPMELRARTPEGAALVASAERLADDLAAGAAARDRDGSYPFEGIDALRRAGYFGAPVPEELGGLGVGSIHDVGDRLGPAGPGRRVARDRRQHAPGRRPEPGAPLADGARGGQRPPRAGVRRLAARDRLGRRRDRRRDERARSGPHAAGHERGAHRRRLADRRPQDLLHDVAGGDRAADVRAASAARTAASATATSRSRRPRPA